MTRNQQLKGVNKILEQTQYDDCLGMPSAELEWADPDEAQKIFLQTTAYSKFISKSNWILLGRVGTGKTAIMRRFEKQVKDNELHEYGYCVLMQFSDILRYLEGYDSIDSSAKTFETLKANLAVIINIFAMKKITEYMGDLVTINKYLQGNGFTDDDEIWRKFKRAFEKASALPGNTGTIANTVSVLSNIIDVFADATYKAACDEMHRALKTKNMVVLVDTMDENYDVRDSQVMTLTKALIGTCFMFALTAKTSHVFLKMSLPSEIHTHILDELPDKLQGNTVAIQWKYKDLICFLALRIFNWATKNEYSFAQDFSIDDFYPDNSSSNKKSAELISCILPEFCPTSSAFEFSTIAYCLRHTLRKPREILYIFNKIVDKIMQESYVRYFYDHPNEIRDIIHSCEERLISGTLAMYQAAYPNLKRTFQDVLANKYYKIEGSDLIHAVKEAAARTVKHEKSYDAEDILLLLFETGFIGKANAETFMKPTSRCVKSKDGINIISTLFEYQIKGGLNAQRNGEYIIHPMCYEEFSCSFSKTEFVYPETSDDNTDIIYLALKDSV